MKILFIGDIVGRSGREAVKKILPDLKIKENIHLVVANCENVAHGLGLTTDTMKELLSYGIDFFTSGNHIWKVKEMVRKLNDKSIPVIRPANYPSGNPGRGFDFVEGRLMKKVLVINLQGRVFMKEGLDNPFKKADEIIDTYKNDPSISAIIVDFHAEATSEKNAMRHYLDGRVSALFGTHTHVQTNDAIVSKEGTAYITDAGMTGVYENSVLGVDKKSSLELFLLGNIFNWEQAEGESILCGVIIEIDEKTKKSISIKIVQEKA